MIELGGGKQVVVNSDLGKIHLALWVNRGSSGVELTRSQAIKLRAALLGAIMDAEKVTT